jgi:hypothetical protein
MTQRDDRARGETNGEELRGTLLENVRIASPCSASWEHMVGDDRVRFCGACEKNVYNLSALPRDEAESLLAQHEGSICVRLYRRADGTVLTADCPVGVRKKRVKRLVVLAAGAGALAAAAGAAFAGQHEPPAVMGRGVEAGDFATELKGRPEVTSLPVPAPAPTTMGSVATPPPASPPAHVMGRRPAHHTMGVLPQ